MPRKPKKKIPAPVVPVVIPAEAVFITARELAGLLRKSLKSIYRLAKKNQIAHIHDGGLRFDRKSVEAYLAARLVPASPVQVKQTRRAA
jgi:excisionase family DNA binding protein